MPRVMNVVRCLPLLALGFAGCSSTEPNGLPSADNRGWVRAGASFSLVQPGPGALVALNVDNGVTVIDGTTGTVRWRAQLGAREYARWIGPEILMVGPFDAERRVTYYDASSGRVLSSSAVQNTPSRVVDTWSIGAPTEDLLVGMTRFADSVVWQRSFQRVSCARSPVCRYFSILGTSRNVAYVEVSYGLAATSALLRVEPDGQMTQYAVPFVVEPTSTQERRRGISAVEPLFWSVGEHGAHMVDLTTGAVRWQVPTSAIMVLRPGASPSVVHAAEDTIERTMRIAYLVRDSVRGAISLEGVVLRTADGTVVRRMSIPGEWRLRLAYAGACGRDHLTMVDERGTIRSARWNTGAIRAWRSATLAAALPALLDNSFPRFSFIAVAPAGMLFRMDAEDRLAGLPCET